MIPAVSQTLARVLACQTSLETVQQVTFDHPRTQPSARVGINLYAYDVRPADGLSHRREETHRSAVLTAAASAPEQGLTQLPPGKNIEISFLIVAHDQTRLGEQRLLSEALACFVNEAKIPHDLLAPVLQNWGGLAVAIARPLELTTLWRALGVPLQPALYLTVTVLESGFQPHPAPVCLGE
ncbi:MAG: Pvc16 family protein [Cyanobacteria bacterium P01_H01_bin.119]